MKIKDVGSFIHWHFVYTLCVRRGGLAVAEPTTNFLFQTILTNKTFSDLLCLNKHEDVVTKIKKNHFASFFIFLVKGEMFETVFFWIEKKMYKTNNRMPIH